MIRINLFPFRAARIKEKIRLQLSIYLGFTLILLLASLYYYINFAKEIKLLNQQKKEKQERLDSFSNVKARMKKLQDTIDDLNAKLGVIERLEEAKTGPVRMLDHIALSVPKDKLWLTALKEAEGKLVLEGTAMDNETVADFMDNLKEKETIKSVELDSTINKQINEFNLTLKDFSLNCKTYAFKEKPPPEKEKKRRKRR